MLPEGKRGHKKESRLRLRMRYFFNNLLSRHVALQITVLVLVSAMIVLVGAKLVREASEEEFWWSFTRLIDQGTFIDDHEEQDGKNKELGVLVTLCGILILSILIGIISSKITDKLDKLKRGKTQILEKKHYIVCGDGDRLYEVARELLNAREENSIKGKIVLMSSSSREEMEETLSQRLGRRSAIQVICRSGDTTDVDSLKLPCFHRCSGFVVVGDDDGAILKTLVAIRSIVGDRHPVGSCEAQVLAHARIMEMAYTGIHWLQIRKVVLRLIVQICRQPGLSRVYNELLSFEGCEFHFVPSNEVTGCTFRDVAVRIKNEIAIGILREREDGEKEVLINPDYGQVLKENDELLVLSEDGEYPGFTKHLTSQPTLSSRELSTCRKPKRMLILSGRSMYFRFMLELLDKYSEPEARITVAGSLGMETGQALLDDIRGIETDIGYVQVDRTSPEQMATLHPEDYDSVLVVSGKDAGMSDEEADSECIVSLLILKDIQTRLEDKWGSKVVVSEIRNPRNRKLASVSGIDDFVISNEVCSMILAQLVVQPDLGMVYDEIFEPRGCDVILRCASDYESKTFHQLLLEGLERREIVLGWLTGTGHESRAVLNPSRDALAPAEKLTRVVVIAES